MSCDQCETAALRTLSSKNARTKLACLAKNIETSGCPNALTT